MKSRICAIAIERLILPISTVLVLLFSACAPAPELIDPGSPSGDQGTPVPSEKADVVLELEALTKATVEAVPTPEPEMRESANLLPLAGVVWQAGFLNGRPRHPGDEVPEGEYGPERFGEAVVRIESGEELPSTLEAGQRLVLRLPAFPADLYQVGVALGTLGTQRSNMDYSREESLAGRRLLIRWNDRVVSNDGFAPLHAVVTALLLPDEMNREGNLLTLENRGNRAASLDAVWLARARPDTVSFGLLAQEAQWVNRGDAQWIRQTLIRVPGPAHSRETRMEPPELVLSPPNGLEEVRERWRGAGERFHRLVEMEHPDVETLRAWIGPLGDAIRRGMVPSVEVKSEERQRSVILDAAMYVFGDVVHTWQVRDPEWGSSYVYLNEERIQGMRLVRETPVGRTDESPPSFRTLASEVPLEYLIHIAKARRARFDGQSGLDRLNVRNMAHAVMVRQPDGAAFQPGGGFIRAASFLGAVAEALMHTRHQVVLSGLHPAGPFFPDGSDRPGPAWTLMKPLLRFGGPAHHKGHARLRSSMESLSLEGAHWAVADNGKDSVHVFVHAPPNLHGRDVILELPLPWSGETRVLHHTAQARAGTAGPRSDTRTLETMPLTGMDALPADNPYVSLLRTELRLERLQVLELSPVGHSPERREIQAPERVGFSGMNATEPLFTLSREPPAASWTRSTVIRNSRTAWLRQGQVEIEAGVDATVSSLADWTPASRVQAPALGTFNGVTPLRDKSTRIRFADSASPENGYAQGILLDKPLQHGRGIGMWVRAQRPPNLNAPSGSVPTASFYMGTPPYRQRIRIPYDTWIFLHASAERMRRPYFTFMPRFLIWSDPELNAGLDLEINDISVYQISATRGGAAPEESLGFLREREDGKLVLLLVGSPGKAGFWRQRLERAVDTTKLARVLPAAQESEVASTRFDFQAASRILEIELKRFPEVTDETMISRIRTDFPAVADLLGEGKRSAVLMEER